MPEHARFPWLYAALGAVLVLSLLDSILTLAVVSPGLAVEANPLMAALLAQGDLVFVLGKLAMVSAGVAVLWRFRDRPLASLGAGIACGAYVLVLLHHAQSVMAIADWVARA